MQALRTPSSFRQPHRQHARLQRHARQLTCCAQLSSQTSLQPTAGPGKARVKELLAQGQNNYNSTPALTAAVEQMISENPTPQPGSTSALKMAQGTWQVFWAPHIAAMSSPMMTKFEPIIYKIGQDGGSITSNVKWSGSVSGEGWLSASGTIFTKSDSEVEINFDKFWVDMGANSLRPELEGGSSTMDIMGTQIDADAVMSAVGRAFFFPSFAVFPVLYLDEDMAVFAFPPLRSKIAITRVDA